MKKRRKNLPAGMGSGRSISHGYVFKFQGSWHMSVQDSNLKVVLQDNGGDFRAIFHEAYQGVSAVRTIENAGHRLIRDYSFLVERGSVDF